jgi:hypothetical protein
MTEAWEPTNHVEHQLRDALREGDQDTYFALVNGAELFVPLPPGEADPATANQNFTWPTSTREGRTHVLAYTSAEAARACLGPTYEHFVRMSLGDMARSWPDQEWWLALDSGLPIEGYLPAWFIGQLTAGIAPVEPAPEVSPVPEPVPMHETAPPHDGPAPIGGAPPVHEGMPPLPPPTGQDAPPPVPEMPPAPVPAPVPPDSNETIHDGIPRLPVVPGPDGAEAFPAPPQEIVAPVPEQPAAAPISFDGPFDVDVSALTLHIAPDTEFTPLDEEERALHEAAQRGDRTTFLRTLLGVRQIWVPIVDGGDLMLAPGRPGFQWYVDESSGRRVVPIYTGPGRMREAMGGHPFVLSDLAKVLRFWADPSWELVINGATPIGASIPGDRIAPMSAQVDADSAARLASDFPAQSDAERQMFDVRNDPEMVVKVLLDTTVFLPVWSRTPPAVQTRPADPSFPWSAVPVRGHPSVLAFTSFDWMKAAVGTTAFVMPTFAELLSAWPEQDWSVSVNPGTPIEVALSGEQIRGMALPRATEDVPPPVVESPVVESPVVESPVVESPVLGSPVVESSVVGSDAAETTVRETPDEDAAAVPPGPWAIMQKVVRHDHVAWYLEQAYDRVGGFVHRVQDVVDLNTPKLIYESLGLIREGMPFGLDDAEVHVIRWPAYRSGLYRIPFGGQSEEALRSWGDSGWVLEMPPFNGDGFAPGSSGSIREYKVDSMRVPHGSEMYVIGADASERFVARYDADQLSWGDSE